MFKIANAGQAIVETNYFDSEHAKAGYAFMSWNAGAARLLLPDSMCTALAEMREANMVIVSRGPWNGRDALEILFEDDTESPYCLHILRAQTDRSIPEDDQGGGFVLAVWTRSGMALTLPAKYRVVESIPFLQPRVQP